jgi:hypothetical protein
MSSFEALLLIENRLAYLRSRRGKAAPILMPRAGTPSGNPSLTSITSDVIAAISNQAHIDVNGAQHLHALRPKAAKIESPPQARYRRSNKTVAEGDRSFAIVENHS